MEANDLLPPYTYAPGDWITYQGQGTPSCRVGQVVEVDDCGAVYSGLNRCRRTTTTKLLVRWTEGYYTKRTTWVAAYWCRPLSPPPCAEEPSPDPGPPIWETPEARALVEAYDAADWSSRPPWLPLAEAVDAFREPVVPEAMRAEEV